MKKPVKGIDDNSILTSEQKAFLKRFAESDLRNAFRLTGGTALSAFYLEHRLSEDLDFFSSEKVPFYIPEIFLKTLDGVDEITYARKFDRNIFGLKFKNGAILKVEFTFYPLENIDPPLAVNGLQLDSFLDIAVNKLCAIADRIDAKDYVDVYSILRSNGITLEELMNLAERKCEIKGIGHILKSRLLQIPGGIENLPLMAEVKSRDVEQYFRGLIRNIIEKGIER